MKKENLDVKNLNEVIKLANNIFKIAYFLILIIAIYAITLILEKWGVLDFILIIFKILTPLFIGLVVAWLLNPAVVYLHKQKINRTLSTVIVYFVFLLSFYLLISFFIPVFSEQINEFVLIVPVIVDSLLEWVDRLFITFGSANNANIEQIKLGIIETIQQMGLDFTTNLPTLTVNFVASFISGLGILFLGLMIGFFLLFDFEKAKKVIVRIIPRKNKADTMLILHGINTTLKHFVQGILLTSILIFVVCTLLFSIMGLKAPLLFGLVCGITNIIPIVGPYIGGIPPVIVGFVQGPAIGLLILIAILIIQSVESAFIQPLIMSKTMKLHPVSIIVGLLIFGYFFGIIGLMIATPIVSIIKLLFQFFNDKFNIFDFK
ncbi:MAG: AI-2E family transporter [Bacilli bacterium]|nr:AI-2E family transporter [Bacilli bacterium]